jgi:hypothetical protein
LTTFATQKTTSMHTHFSKTPAKTRLPDSEPAAKKNPD